MTTQTKIPTTLMLPLPPKVEDKQDLERYIRQLHKVLDEWHRVSRQDTDYAVEGTHEHDNKTILDAIEQALTTALKAAYDSAVSDKHTHSNKATLDAVQEAFTTALKNAYDGAVSSSHSHTNKTTLDAIQEALTTALKGAYDGAVTHAGLTTGNPHSVTKTDVGLSNVTNDAQVKSADKASQAEAEGGADDTKWMTPLKTKQAIDNLAPAGSNALGSWASKSDNTVYEAETDGFVVAYARIESDENVKGYTDSSNPPTTVVQWSSGTFTHSERYTSIMFPVKKGDYWKTVIDGGNPEVIYWIPLGS